MAHGVLGHLHQHGVPGLQCVLDAARLPVEVGGVPVDFPRIQDCIAAAANIDEGCLHAGQHVLDLAQIDVANQ